MQFAAGLYTLPVAEFSAAGLAGVLAGQQLGIVLGRRLGTVLFFRLIVGFLSLASVILFLRAVS